MNKTGVVFDDRMIEHECIWDPDHIEKPFRYSSPLKKCQDYGLLNRCINIPSKFASEDELLLVHDKLYIEEIKSSKSINDESDLEAFASKYDSVYFNSKTYDSALLAAGSTIQLVSSVLNGVVNNGMAIVRPPGHHAMKADACGFCFFNNVAIAAKYAIKHFNLSRILIIDWDVHHGQATQQTFYDDSRVLYFSIHRYQNGAFWPHLRESNFDYSGGISAKGFNVNVPLNGSGQGNSEYLAIFNNILLPIAYEFSPELVLISAGYDAALGCPEGEMKVFPQMYPHFINMLSCLAGGKTCVVLEGGYCETSLSESVALTLRGLLGDPCPMVRPCLGVNQVTVDSILSVLTVQRVYWESIRVQPLYESDSDYNGEKHFVHIEYTGNPLEGLLEFPTKDYNPVVLSHVTALLESELRDLILKTDLSVPSSKTCFIVNYKLEPVNETYSLKSTVKILNSLFQSGLLSKCTWLELKENPESDITALLNIKAIKKIKSNFKISEEVRMQLEQNFSEPECLNASYSFLQLVHAVVSRISVNGFSFAQSVDKVCNTVDKLTPCKFSKIALAATYLTEQHFMKRVLIIDWSVEHNNTMQQRFYEDDKVLCISLHNCSKKNCSMSIDHVGTGRGKGYNVNIPFNHNVIDGDYLTTLFHVILPIAYEYAPEFILISSPFTDKSFSLLTPTCYGVMVKLLSSLCNGKIVIDFEGWNNDISLDNMLQCISSLVGDFTVPSTHEAIKPCSRALETLRDVVKVQKKFWRNLAFYKALPNSVPIEMKAIKTHKEITSRQSSDPVAIPRKENEPGTSKAEDWIGEAAGFSSGMEMFCVTPLEYCPHLDLLQPIPAEGMNPFARCNRCNDPNENWVCLHCYQVYCGRFINQHMVQHGQDMQHFLTLSYSDLSVWCYACDAYIHNEFLVPIKEHAHSKKFGR